MYKHIVILIIATSLTIASTAQAADISVNTTGPNSIGSYAQFDVRISQFQPYNDGTTGILSVLNTTLEDVASAEYSDGGVWSTINLEQSGEDVLGRFPAPALIEASNQYVTSIRINFKTPKTYVLGYSLEKSGQTTSSAAIPITITGPQVLGATISSYKFTRMLRVGSSGTDVFALQNKLVAEGLYSGPVTGYFGLMTKAAVARYQRIHGISPMGIVGPLTLASLNQ